jgi:Fur family ferric uptake transcriptional regulator
LLVECGLVEEVALEDDRRMYEHTYGHDPHDHIVCVDCKKVFEFDGAPVIEMEQSIARAMGFAATGHRLRIEAACEQLRTTGACDRKEIKLI